jgi:hypothetical protein
MAVFYLASLPHTLICLVCICLCLFVCCCDLSRWCPRPPRPSVRQKRFGLTSTASLNKPQLWTAAEARAVFLACSSSTISSPSRCE